MIVDIRDTIKDGDFAVIFYVKEQQVALRNLLIDGNSQVLQSIIDTNLIEPFTDNTQILGIVAQSKLTYTQ